MLLPRPKILLSSALLTLSFATALAQSPAPAPAPAPTASADPDRVEEDWELVVSNPDPLGVGPQVTTCMAADSGDPSTFVAFDMNYREYPAFRAGGMQLQVWSSKQVIGTASRGTEVFNTPGETVSWTQRMWIDAGRVYYDVQNGQSVTWGKFGQGSGLNVSHPATAANLAGYTSKDSSVNSGVTWEANYVKSLTLVRVRYYTNGVLTWTDNNPKVLVSSDDAPAAGGTN